MPSLSKNLYPVPHPVNLNQMKNLHGMKLFEINILL